MFSISSGQFTYSGEITVIAKVAFMIKMVLTIPGFKHVVDEEVVKPDLGFWDRACRSVELGHHNGQALADIIVIIIIVIRRKILGGSPLTWAFSSSVWAKYSSAILSAHTRQCSRGRAGLDTSAHLISILQSGSTRFKKPLTGKTTCGGSSEPPAPLGSAQPSR